MTAPDFVKMMLIDPADTAVLAKLPEVQALIAAALLKWPEFPADAKAALDRMLREERNKALREAASVACNACLVDPDGGNPTEDERLVCEEAYRRILALIQEAPHDPA